MLKGDFFTIERIVEKESATQYFTHLNASHEIYNGHFPGDPICPGVCNVQTIRECAEMKTGKKLRIDSISICRFSALITPTGSPDLLISLELTQNEDKTYAAIAKITSPDEQTLYLEYKGTYSEEM